MAIDPAWLALVGTLCGGAGLKFAEHWLGRNKVKVDEASKIRDELRISINSQKEEIKALEAEVNKWRAEYYDLRDKYSEIQTKYTIALEKIREEAERTRQEITEADGTHLDPPTEP